MLDWLGFNKKKKDKTNDELVFDDKPSIIKTFVEIFQKGGGEIHISKSIEETAEIIQNWIKKYKLKEVVSFDEDWSMMLKNISSDLVFSDNLKGQFCFSTCESLIAFDGSIMISSDQVDSYELDDLPEIFMVYAGMEQLVSNASDGLRLINSLKRNKLPSKISSIRGKEMQNFGEIRNSKKILLIIED